MKIMKVVACVMVLTMTIGDIASAEVADPDATLETLGGTAQIGAVATYVATRAGAPAVLTALKGLGLGALGVSGGVAIAGAANGIAGAAIVNNTFLADDENLDEGEREARSTGRSASYIGGVAGGLGSLAVVTGSAASITSTLATVGSVVGGGMAAGGAILVTAPVAVATAAGIGAWGVVKLVKWAFD
jgi:hypothetical protein